MSKRFLKYETEVDNPMINKNGVLQSGWTSNDGGVDIFIKTTDPYNKSAYSIEKLSLDMNKYFNGQLKAVLCNIWFDEGICTCDLTPMKHINISVIGEDESCLNPECEITDSTIDIVFHVHAYNINVSVSINVADINNPFITDINETT